MIATRRHHAQSAERASGRSVTNADGAFATERDEAGAKWVQLRSFANAAKFGAVPLLRRYAGAAAAFFSLNWAQRFLAASAIRCLPAALNSPFLAGLAALGDRLCVVYG